MNSRRSRSVSGLLGGYPGISQGPRSILGDAADEEGEEYEEIEVEASLAGAPEASEASNLALSIQPLVSQADGGNDSINGTTHSSSFPQNSRLHP
ncbi:hypothetical protein O181_049869 [Austropuccinia psidii MF-1]|uniref:Uncharacterized protein n=1 Tax=Austropuccinia psidii MF-1 TaxID=1389203 RepID=A0A9Q3DVN8_9BASI|nr:hypothetical protein [Austropuccinia psidii MF-1]